MMPGIAIQPGFAIAGTSAVRNAQPAADDRFSHALHEKPKAPAQAGRKPDEATKAEATDNGDGAHKTAPHNDDKAAQPALGKGSRDKAGDEDRKKDKDDADSSALPPHMKAERTLAQQWADSVPATAAQGTAADSAPAGGTNATAPATGTAQAVSLAEASGAGRPATALPMPVMPAQPAAAGNGSGTGTAAPMQANPAGTDPAPKGVSVVAATAADAEKAAPGSISAPFMAKVAASQQEAAPAGSQQGAGGAASTSAPDAKPAMSQIPQATAGQGSGNADANANGKGDGGNGQPDKGAQNAGQIAAGAKGDAAAPPLPTAQMVPSSGGAASFAGALQQGGLLSRYAASAAAALAAGTPAGALPVQSLSIQLRPVELGSVTANLKYAGSGLSIDIQVETPEAHRRLSNDSSDIVKSLQSLGFQVDKVTVRQASAQMQAQSQGQPQQGQGQAQGQATGRDGSAGGFANQGGSPFSMSGQSGGNGHRQGSEGSYENGSERGVGMVRETADRLSRRGVFI